MTRRFGTAKRQDPEHLVEDLEAALDESASRLTRRTVPRHLLRRASVRRLLRMALEEWSLIGAGWIGIALSPAWLYPLFAILLAGRFHALGVVLHDSTHMPMRRKTWGIRGVEILCGYPIASTLNAMRYHHLRHHRDSGMETDPYYKGGRQSRWWWVLNVLRGLLLPPFWTVRAIVGAVAWIVPSLRNPYAHVFLQDRSGSDLRDSREVRDCARAEWGQLVFQGGIVAACWAIPREVSLGYLVPLAIAGLLAARRVLVEHNYIRTFDRSVETILATTNDHDLGWLGRLGLAPRHIGFHVVHHIHPQVALEELPRLRSWYLARHPAYGPEGR